VFSSWSPVGGSPRRASCVSISSVCVPRCASSILYGARFSF
jgi:hypothetical protein